MAVELASGRRRSGEARFWDGNVAARLSCSLSLHERPCSGDPSSGTASSSWTTTKPRVVGFPPASNGRRAHSRLEVYRRSSISARCVEGITPMRGRRGELAQAALAVRQRLAMLGRDAGSPQAASLDGPDPPAVGDAGGREGETPSGDGGKGGGRHGRGRVHRGRPYRGPGRARRPGSCRGPRRCPPAGQRRTGRTPADPGWPSGVNNPTPGHAARRRAGPRGRVIRPSFHRPDRSSDPRARPPSRSTRSGGRSGVDRDSCNLQWFIDGCVPRRPGHGTLRPKRRRRPGPCSGDGDTSRLNFRGCLDSMSGLAAGPGSGRRGQAVSHRRPSTRSRGLWDGPRAGWLTGGETDLRRSVGPSPRRRDL